MWGALLWVGCEVPSAQRPPVEGGRADALRGASFSALPSMAEPRSVFSATVLPTGSVLVAGGGNSLPGELDSAEIYDPLRNRWRSVAALPQGRFLHGASVLRDGRVMLTGGIIQGAATSSTTLFDVELESWSAGPPMTVPRNDLTAHLLNDGRLIVAGGSAAPPSAELFDPQANTWALAPSGVGSFYAGYGSSRLSPDEVLFHSRPQPRVFDAASGTWSSVGAMTVLRGNVTSVLLTNGMMLVAGGNVSGMGAYPNCELYDPVGRVFAPAQSMNDARYDHAAVRLPSAKVLVLGGGGVQNVVLGSAEIYDPTFDVWTLAASMSTGRVLHSATVLYHGGVLVMGGYGDTTELSTAELFRVWNDSVTGATPLPRPSARPSALLLPSGNVLALADLPQLYDPVADQWTLVDWQLGAALKSSTLTLLADGRVFLAGGQLASTPTANALRYEPATGSWADVAPMRFPRAEHVALALSDGRVVVAGGSDSAGPLRSAETFEPASGTWALAAPMRLARKNARAVLLPSGDVLVVGGESSAGSLDSAEVYEPRTNAWTLVAPMQVGRAAPIAQLLPDGTVLVAGGWQAGTPLSSAERFDPSTRTWVSAAPMLEARADASATLLLNGRVFVAGGEGPLGALGSAELYDFVSNSWVAAAPLDGPRTKHVATMLDDGRVLLTGGEDDQQAPVASALLYDEGRGAGPSWTPTLQPLSQGVMRGAQVQLTGTLFTGVGEASSGQSPAPNDAPLLLLQHAESGQHALGRMTRWTSSSANAELPTDMPGGWAWARVVVNGVPSLAQPIWVSDGSTVPVCPSGPCTPPRFVSPPVTSAVCFEPYQYQPQVEGTGPFRFHVSGPGERTAPEGFTMDEGTGEARWVPSRAQAGAQPIELWVDSPGGSDLQAFTLEVECAPSQYVVGCGCGGGGAWGGGPLLWAWLLWRARRQGSCRRNTP